MATPLAHKGATAGAKVQAMTIVDFRVQPDLIAEAWDYFENVQTKAIEYAPLICPADRPAIELNKDIMAEFRPAMREFYYDPARYDTYLDQLGVSYPTIDGCAERCVGRDVM